MNKHHQGGDERRGEDRQPDLRQNVRESAPRVAAASRHSRRSASTGGSMSNIVSGSKK